MKKYFSYQICILSLLMFCKISFAQNAQSKAKYEIYTSKGYKGLKLNENVVVDAKYTDIEFIDDNFYSVKKQDIQTLYSTQAKEIINIPFTNIYYDKIDGLYKVYNEEIKKYALLNSKGIILLPLKYDDIYTISKNMYIVDKSKLYSHDSIIYSSNMNLLAINGIANCFIEENGYDQHNYNTFEADKLSIIDTLGRVLYAKPDSIKKIIAWQNSEKQLCLIYSNHKNIRGVLNISLGKSIINYDEYYMIRFFSKDLLIVQNNGINGIVNLKNEEILPFEYSDISSLDNGIAMATKDNSGKQYAINENGKILFDVSNYSEIFGTRFNLVFVSKNNKYGLKNEKGIDLLPCTYDNFKRFNPSGVGFVKKGYLWSNINKAGQFVNPNSWFKIIIPNSNSDFWFVNWANNEYVIVADKNVSSDYFESEGTYNLLNVKTGKFLSSTWFGPKIVNPTNNQHLFETLSDGNLLVCVAGKWYRYTKENKLLPY